MGLQLKCIKTKLKFDHDLDLWMMYSEEQRVLDMLILEFRKTTNPLQKNMMESQIAFLASAIAFRNELGKQGEG